MSDLPSQPSAPLSPRGGGGPLGAVRGRADEYLQLSATLTYSFLFVLPLIVLYEIGTAVVNAGSSGEIRVSADVFIKRVLAMVGIEGTLWLSVFVLAVGAGIIIFERRKGITIKPRYFAYMFGESSVYAVLSGTAVAWFVASLFSLQWPPGLQVAGKTSFAQGLVLSLGAGIYEELVFRLLLVSAIMWALALVKQLGKGKRYTIAAVIGALIFSAVHYIGALGDAFTLQSFTFRFIMGLVLNLLFLWRGFGIAAMTHALYDVFVTVMHGG